MRTIGALWLGLGLLMALLAVGDLGVPGPYYDEVIQALPAAEFLDGQVRAAPLPGSEVLRLGGRPFPWMTQGYMGALKSQLLIPCFALAGSELTVLRITTLAWSAVGLLFCIAFARRSFGTGVAAVSGLLLVCDASFLFVSRHDWGSFSLGFLLRCASLLFAALWWESGRLRHALLAGAALGLGIYNKVDFALFPAAAILAVLAADRDAVRHVLRERRAQAAAAIATAFLFASPVLAAIPEFGGAAGRLAEDVTYTQKTLALESVIDGSYFLRLMRVGGRFDAMALLEDVPLGGLGIAVVLAGLGLAAAAVRRSAPAGTVLLLLCSVLLAGLLLLLPGAVRAHHLMNLYPFPHWIAAVGLVALWREKGAARGSSPRSVTVRRALAAALLLALVASSLRVVWLTHAEIRQSGGRGYWSDAVVGFVEEARAVPGGRVVCLDWGLHNQVAFLGPELRSLDAIWMVRRALARGETWSLIGDSHTAYLIHDEPFDLFGLGGRFQRALEKLPRSRVSVHPYLDREGGVAFLAVRLDGPHRVAYDGRSFSIGLAPTPARSHESGSAGRRQ